MLEPKRITAFVGHYGSGKTELAINYALALKKLGKRTVIVDFDIVNPYFRTKDAEASLTGQGIEVIAPAFANTNIENPALPPEIYRIFTDRDCYGVFDVGGGEDGAIPLGRYYPYFSQEPCDLFFVLNQRRLQTDSLEGALEAYHEIAAVLRMPVTALINNTHLKEETTPEMLLEGQALAQALGEKLGLPVAYTSGLPAYLDKIPAEGDIQKLPLTLFLDQSL